MTDKPLVGILMGSDSDLPVMQDAAKVLEELGITSEVHTLSAHRTPEAPRIWRASLPHTPHFPSSAYLS